MNALYIQQHFIIFYIVLKTEIKVYVGELLVLQNIISVIGIRAR